jgi:hypothetical protein
VRVTGLAPDDPGKVLNPRCMLIDEIYIRAKPFLTYVIPKHEGKG